MAIEKLILLSVHASPLARAGGPKMGGMNIYIREIAKQMAARGIKVDIYTRRYNADLPEVDDSLGENIRVIHIAAGPPILLPPEDIYQHLSEFAAGVIAFTTKKTIVYDYIYSHYWLSGWVANKLREVWGIPFAQMFHTLGQMKNRIIKGYPTTILPDIRVTVENQVIEWADRIIVATPAEYTQLLWLYRADRRKISILSPGVDTTIFQPIPTAEAKQKIGIEDNTHLLLYVGRLEPLKGIDTILEALHHIKNHNPQILDNVRCLIIGGDNRSSDAQEIAGLKALREQLQLNDIVEFIGAKDHALLPYYYAAATVVIMPSDYESFGMVAVEAMASGTPVIASEVGGLAYLVRNDETGFLIPTREPMTLAERIVNIISNPQKVAQMRQAAIETAKQYAWPTIAAKLIDIFQQSIKQSPNREARV
ncbi:MAG: glycosyltransferase family 1 protein [Chloroflexi bacterium]|nr:MAG: glycosyltransferase family 1 protein [Phototrophicales bacterium]RMF78092.1 MAG: glycosyltransferase family 1 protein [Chloroflexota bacterium]